jgi:hypothetical protein
MSQEKATSQNNPKGFAALQNHGKLSKEFIALFAGKFDVSLKGLGYQKAFDWLSEGSSFEKANACMVFFTKPLQFLETGKTKQGKGDGEAVSRELIKYLPVLSEEEGKDITNEYRLKSHFKLVNFTMVRVVALLFAEFGRNQGLVLQWRRKWGATPSRVNTEFLHQSMSETVTIMANHLDAFRADIIVWDSYNWVPFMQ